MTQAFLPVLKRGGRIINISSPVTRTKLPLSSVYAASKAGLEALSDSLYLEAIENDIHIVILDPGNNLFNKTNLGAKQLENYNQMNGGQILHKKKFNITKSILSCIKRPSLEMIEEPNIIRWV